MRVVGEKVFSLRILLPDVENQTYHFAFLFIVDSSIAVEWMKEISNKVLCALQLVGVKFFPLGVCTSSGFAPFLCLSRERNE